MGMEMVMNEYLGEMKRAWIDLICCSARLRPQTEADFGAGPITLINYREMNQSAALPD